MSMKKLFLLLTIIICSTFAFAKPVSAITITPTPTTPTEKSTPETEINKLKDRIASRVAELKLVERRGIIGNTSEVSSNQITLNDVQNNIRFVDVDELTKFSSPSAKGSFGISDITKGNTLGVLGLYNKQSRRMLARFVDVLVLPKIINGAIVSSDIKEFTIQIVNEKNEKIIIDVENTTKTQSFTKDGGSIRAGFSKIKDNERIMVAGYPEKNEKNRISAARIILFPEIPVNPQIKLPNQTTKSSTSSAK